MSDVPKRDVILIIDDDSRNIFALQLLLKSRHVKYTSVLSAKEGLRLLQDDPCIAMVFMDMMMPDMDGYEAIKTIQSSDMYPQIPIVAVTAQAMSGDRERCIKLGATDYISKPVNVDELMTVIQNYL